MQLHTEPMGTLAFNLMLVIVIACDRKKKESETVLMKNCKSGMRRKALLLIV